MGMAPLETTTLEYFGSGVMAKSVVFLFQTVRYSKMGVSENRGAPKWMVYMENPIKMDDLGVPLFLETPKWLEPPCCFFFVFQRTITENLGNK